MTAHEATLYHQDSAHAETVVCDLCTIAATSSRAGRASAGCGATKRAGSSRWTIGKAVAPHADPIEKKPLFHFLPGTRSMSVATVGCNFRCEFCKTRASRNTC